MRDIHNHKHEGFAAVDKYIMYAHCSHNIVTMHAGEKMNVGGMCSFVCWNYIDPSKVMRI